MDEIASRKETIHATVALEDGFKGRTMAKLSMVRSTVLACLGWFDKFMSIVYIVWILDYIISDCNIAVENKNHVCRNCLIGSAAGQMTTVPFPHVASPRCLVYDNWDATWLDIWGCNA